MSVDDMTTNRNIALCAWKETARALNQSGLSPRREWTAATNSGRTLAVTADMTHAWDGWLYGALLAAPVIPLGQAMGWW